MDWREETAAEVSFVYEDFFMRMCSANNRRARTGDLKKMAAAGSFDSKAVKQTR